MVPSYGASLVAADDRLPVRIKAEANSRDVPYPSLAKIWLEEELPAGPRSKVRP